MTTKYVFFNNKTTKDNRMMQSKPRHVITIFITCLFLIITGTVLAQKKHIDAFFLNKKYYADSISDVGFTSNSATCIKYNLLASKAYESLAKEYNLTDMPSYFYISVAAQNPETFYNSGKELILHSTLHLSQIVERFGNIYGKNDTNSIHSEPLKKAYEKLLHEEPSLIRQARLSLDWNYMMELTGLFKANIDFRLIHHFITDSANHSEAFLLIDSTHFIQFCELLEKYKYPTFQKTGITSYYVNVLLRHFTEFAALKGERGDYFMKRWRWLMPYLHDAVLEGNLDPGLYKHVIEDWIIPFLQGSGRIEDISFFEKFTIKI